MFDLTIQIIGHHANQIDENSIELILAPALALPGPQGPIPLQIGLVHTPMSKDAAQELVDKIQAAINGEEYKPKEKSDLIVASSLQGVEDVAKMEAKLKGK